MLKSLVDTPQKIAVWIGFALVVLLLCVVPGRYTIYSYYQTQTSWREEFGYRFIFVPAQNFVIDKWLVAMPLAIVIVATTLVVLFTRPPRKP
jgi:hypothetical protein